MSTDTFEKTNWNWRVQQLQQQVGEWFELQLSKAELDPLPDLALPPWLIQGGLWLIAGLFLTWLLWIFLKQLRLPAWQAAATHQSRPAQAAKFSSEEWLKRSQAFQNQGNYHEACRALYMAMLQHLNDTQSVPHQSSRSDGEYLQLVQSFPHPQPYQTLIRTHEQLCFSDIVITPTIMNRAQRAYQAIEQI